VACGVKIIYADLSFTQVHYMEDQAILIELVNPGGIRKASSSHLIIILNLILLELRRSVQ